MWIGLVTVCVMGIVSVTDPHARELTTSAAWGADQVINTMAGLMGAGIVGWISDHRFAIATLVLILAALDMLMLACLRSIRLAARQRPRVRLREWMELPLPALTPVAVTPPLYRVERMNRRLGVAVAFAAATVLGSTASFALWARDVVLPGQSRRLAHAAEAGRVQSRAGLESLRDTAAQLQFAARAWYEAAAAPAVSEATSKAAHAIRSAARAGREAASTEAASAQVVDIHALLSAQSIGWYGPLSPAPTTTAQQGDEHGDEPRSDRLAS